MRRQFSGGAQAPPSAWPNWGEMSEMASLPLGIVFVLAALVILVSTAVQAATGFGFSIVALPLLVPLLGVRTGVVVSLVLSMVANGALSAMVYPSALPRVVRPLLLGGLVGVLPGIALFHWVDLTQLKLGISAIVTIIAVALLAGLTLRVRLRRRWSVAAGIASGLLGGAVGLAGPPLTIYLAGVGLDKVTYRATVSVYFTLLNIVLVPVHLFGSGSWRALLWSGILLPSVAIGGKVGHWIIGGIDDAAFARAVAAVVLAAGLIGLVLNWP